MHTTTPRRPDAYDGWARNVHGNLTKEIDGELFTVFRRGVRYRWSARSGGQVIYSDESFPTVDDAIADAVRTMVEVAKIDIGEMEDGYGR